MQSGKFRNFLSWKRVNKSTLRSVTKIKANQ